MGVTQVILEMTFPWMFLRRWVQAQLPDAKDDIGDTWTWKAAGASIIKG